MCGCAGSLVRASLRSHAPSAPQVWFCMCGNSAKFPLCDGAHKAFNAAHKTSVKPAKVESDTDRVLRACGEWGCGVAGAAVSYIPERRAVAGSVRALDEAPSVRWHAQEAYELIKSNNILWGDPRRA